MKRGRSVYIQIHGRNPKLKAVSEEKPDNPEKLVEQVEAPQGKGDMDAVKQNMINKIAELSADLTPENIKLIEILSNGLKLL